MSKAVLFVGAHTFIVLTMASFEQARRALERIAMNAFTQAHITGADPTLAVASQKMQPKAFLYLSKDDLASPERGTSAMRLIQRHFR